MTVRPQLDPSDTRASLLLRRTPAQWYCLAAGLSLLAAGIVGFFVDASFETGSSLSRGELIVFDVNGWHNLVHLLTGLLLVLAAPQASSARAVALVFGLTYAVVSLIGLIDGRDIFGLLPINAADTVLHLALSVLGVLAALVSGNRTPEPRHV